jgi:hypothetical protein
MGKMIRQLVGAKKFIGRILTKGATRGHERAARRGRGATLELAAGRHSMEIPRTQPRETSPGRASMDVPLSSDSDMPFYEGFQPSSPPSSGHNIFGTGSSSVHGDYGIPERQTQGGEGGTDAFSFGYDFFADLGLQYQAYVTPADEHYSDAERDDEEPVPEVQPQTDRRAVARGKRRVGEPVVRPDEGDD